MASLVNDNSSGGGAWSGMDISKGIGRTYGYRHIQQEGNKPKEIGESMTGPSPSSPAKHKMQSPPEKGKGSLIDIKA